MNKNTIAILKGTSGTGKGTRVRQFLEFCKKNYEYIELKIDSYKTKKKNKITGENEIVTINKQKELGIYIREINTLFLGKLTTSNKSGLESWTSLDYFNGIFNSTELVCKMIQELSEKYNLIAEGEPMLLSFRYRPIWMFETYNINKLLIQIYSYPNKEEYLNRIIGRSGKKPNGNGGWSRNNGYLYSKENKHITEQKEINKNQNINCVIEFLNYDESLTKFAESYLKLIDRTDLIVPFNEYSVNTNFKRNVSEIE